MGLVLTWLSVAAAASYAGFDYYVTPLQDRPYSPLYDLERIETAVSSGAVEVLWGTNVTEISPTALTLVDKNGRTRSRPNDYVFIFAGGELPTSFLKSCGVRIETKFGRP